ncbi:MAG: BolA family transcriptional regulator [Gammaproteobacteria bacterium]|nr:BolA family transcriptional regulator [Rhodocyclaceae bacterium]MBU3910804.1 BolA family transcriptional regulator [Gammaproteobacteria bacterium]MBU3988445.1 BolA family transcriptional regulator [Gammaproteobacteria bacterium]MBU4006258.1 BolA family transcriptional regulator [Gammaproteobacteria bacterium]MBU4097865.1 BolA family transcriptional regulator [Gammaproteobacteria bacterium]
MSTVDYLREKLEQLAPVQLDIRDDSARHAGHAGAKSGGHYVVSIVAARFAGLGTMQRHRLVYDAAGDLMQNGIHALSITARTPEEMQA